MSEGAWVGGEAGSVRADQEDRRAEPAVAEMLSVTQTVQKRRCMQERCVYIHVSEVERDEMVHQIWRREVLEGGYFSFGLGF